MLAASILLATILVLVDKNHQWRNFWRALAVFVLMGALGLAGFYVHQHYEAKSQIAPTNEAWQDYQPAH